MFNVTQAGESQRGRGGGLGALPGGVQRLICRYLAAFVKGYCSTV